MAPHAIYDEPFVPDTIVDEVKAKVVLKHVELEPEPPKPVADDFMYDFKYNHALPTTDVLQVEVPVECDARQVAEHINAQLESTLSVGDAEKFVDLFLEYGTFRCDRLLYLREFLTIQLGVWRDKLSFTWDYRTFNFRPAILQAAKDLLPTNRASNFRFLQPQPKIHRPYPDYTYLQYVASFETDKVLGSAVINAVLTREGWKIYTMHSVAEQLKDFPELPPYDGHMTGPVTWAEQRAEDTDKAQPEILIIGGGQK